MDTTTYLKERVNDQITWMEEKSKHNQQRYKLLKVLEIIAAAVIPFLAGYHEVRSIAVITGLLGVFIVVINSLQQLYKYHENWITYRTTIEALKREKLLYETASDPYHDGTAFQKFVQNFEALLANENTVWKAAWTQKAEQK